MYTFRHFAEPSRYNLLTLLRRFLSPNSQLMFNRRALVVTFVARRERPDHPQQRKKRLVVKWAAFVGALRSLVSRRVQRGEGQACAQVMQLANERIPMRLNKHFSCLAGAGPFVCSFPAVSSPGRSAAPLYTSWSNI